MHKLVVLRNEISERITVPAPEGMSPLINDILEEYGDAVRTVVFYGSCLQKGDIFDGLVDLYIIVDSYRNAFGAGLEAMAARLIPPNVYYIESACNGKRIRSKYAVISMWHLRRAVSMKWFHSYFWARFCQPSALVYTADKKVADELAETCANSVMTMLTRIIPCNNTEFTTTDLWKKGLNLTYSAELRPERPERVEKLVDLESEWFEAVTEPAMNALPFKVVRLNKTRPVRWKALVNRGTRFFCRLAWRARRIQGKCLSIVRLAKAAFTFKGGVDYIVWKIERHSGVTVEVSPFLRRHPILAMVTLSLRIFKSGSVH